MRRTNIVLEEWQYQYLKDRAAGEGRSLSALIRELIEAAAASPRRRVKQDPIFSVVGLCSGKGRAVSQRHDEILYRKER